MFKGADDRDQLVKICKVLGTEDLRQYCDRYGLDVPKTYNGPMPEYPRQPWSVFFTAENRSKCTTEALDLLTLLLQYDHQVGTGDV